MPAEVSIFSKQGETFTARTNYPKGDPENPVNLEELQDKFRLLAGLKYAPRPVEDLITSIAGLEQIKEMHELLKFAGSPAY